MKTICLLQAVDGIGAVSGGVSEFQMIILMGLIAALCFYLLRRKF
jgi:hypothetical protein